MKLSLDSKHKLIIILTDENAWNYGNGKPPSMLTPFKSRLTLDDEYTSMNTNIDSVVDCQQCPWPIDIAITWNTIFVAS